MNQIFTTVNALRKAVESSRPNVKFTKIMGYVDQLESQLNGLNLCKCPSTKGTEDTTTSLEDDFNKEIMGEVNKELKEILVESSNEGSITEPHPELNFEELEKLSLSELRELFPDIKATSKANFLEQLRAQ